VQTPLVIVVLAGQQYENAPELTTANPLAVLQVQAPVVRF